MKIEKLTLREMGLIATIFAVLLMAALWKVRASPRQRGEKRSQTTIFIPSIPLTVAGKREREF